MILTGSEIINEVSRGKITIDPFNISLVNPNSYNYQLGDTIYQVKEFVIDPKRKTSVEKIIITNKGFVLQPNRLYLATTYEIIGSSKYVTSLIGRSSLGRLGLFLQITADLGHVGNKHKWTLELKVVEPLRVYPFMKVGQVTFWSVKDKNQELYNGEYGTKSVPYVSNFYKQFL